MNKASAITVGTIASVLGLGTVVWAGSLLWAGMAFAADGDLSATESTATSEVTAVIPQLIRITGLDDLDMGTYDPAAPGDMTANSVFCVYRNSTAGEYTLKLEGDGGLDATTDFEIDNGTEELAYTVDFGDDSAGALTNYATPAADLTDQVANSVDATCTTGVQAELEVTVDGTDALNAKAGTYTGDLIVTVTVE